MNRTTLMSVLATAILLAGCALTGGPRVTHCLTDNCTVTVKVNSCSSITATPDWLEFAAGKKGDIEWNLDAAANWEFSARGIEFKDPANPEFDTRRPGAKKFKWKNKHTRPGQHDYNVFVTPDGGKTECKLDPTIMNR